MWYHVTPEYIGKSIILNPHVPTNANTDREGNIPRICVSDSIFKCLRALKGREFLNSIDFKDKYTENLCVYYTEEVPYTPPNCDDFRYNAEKWFIKKTKFYFLARVDMYYLFRYNKVIPTMKKEIKFPKTNMIITKPKEEFLRNILRGEVYGKKRNK